MENLLRRLHIIVIDRYIICILYVSNIIVIAVSGASTLRRVTCCINYAVSDHSLSINCAGISHTIACCNLLYAMVNPLFFDTFSGKHNSKIHN